MSIVAIENVGHGSPLRATFRVDAGDAVQAIALAKAEARASGYRVKTLGWSKPSADGAWDVMLCVRPA